VSEKDRHKKAIEERKKRERSQRIQSILDAARLVFRNRGYLGATMGEVAFEAQVSKPTVYQYFKTKEDLFFSLMLPVIETMGSELSNLEGRLSRGEYGSGAALLGDLFDGLIRVYEEFPVAFRIVQLFQQSRLVRELDEEIRTALNEKGGRNFVLARKIVEQGIKRGLLKKTDPYRFVDVIWGLFVGVVQLEDIKSQNSDENRFVGPTLKLAEKLIIDAMTPAEDAPDDGQ
jgi:AcrR family transcriptional regulator